MRFSHCKMWNEKPILVFMDDTKIILQGTLSDYVAHIEQKAMFLPGVPQNLINRWVELPHLWDSLLDRFKVDTFSKQIDGPLLPHVHASDRRGRPLGDCLNFASQDYLALSYHPAIRQAAIEAIDQFGVHAAGSPALVGNSVPSARLEQVMAAWLGVTDCVLYPTGWAACYGAVRALVRRTDHVVMDELAHASLQEGARAATAHVHVFRHLSLDSLERRLKRLRASDPSGGVLVVTESLYSMDSDVPDLRAHQELAHRYGASLLVDVAHDLGVLGDAHGLGAQETQEMLGRIDVIVGSFSKAFAANGGFVAGRFPGLKLALRFGSGPNTFSTGPSPIQMSVALKGIEMAQSSEGQQRRRQVMRSAQEVRSLLVARGFTVLGQPSAIVPVLMGGVARSRLMARFMVEQGVLVNLVEHPAVSRNASRLRLQLMASHEPAHLQACVDAVSQAATLADAQLQRINAERVGQAPLV
jgi:glycine C-acetyltransferase